MLLLLGGHTVLPTGHQHGQERSVHSARGHRAVGLSLISGHPQVSWGLRSCTKLCSWTKPWEDWVVPRPSCALRLSGFAKANTFPQEPWLSWSPALSSNLSPNERQAVVFLGHCLLSLLFSLLCSSLWTLPCPCPSPLISKEQELGFGLNMSIKSQCRGLWNPTCIKADAPGVWSCSGVALVISLQWTAGKNLSQLESFMSLSVTFWIFCRDGSYCNFLHFQNSLVWNSCNSTPKNVMIQNIHFAFPWWHTQCDTYF